MAQTMARRCNTISEKWILIVCMASQACPASIWLRLHGCLWGSQVESRVRGHGPSVSQTLGNFKKGGD